ncbi:MULTISPECIES: LCI fold-containing protein [Bacillus]|uniref:LCI fold-containing protein n=1 Tax=Bacillus TaxID=1386 RepID=UPI00032ED7BC|nr:MULTISPECIES: LCI fold-containing protein [Bacillus]EOP29487.1 hypothetical protein IIS_05165 [Bacillus cereus VD131]KAF6547173.1 hypothetical protein G9F74_27570 [Bacillus sp. EKM202B]MBJ8042420.1 hypothetical protein [Bacillus cereus group sp. N17]MBJ8067785.1 hypothetical protein [Bacillus cereus group sp. N15]MCS3599216.1 hypothetical protein [Bacillus sp. JUb91]
MFKKLVVGALATGIALTGGIGAASASTENTANTGNTSKMLLCANNESYWYDRGTDKHYKTVFSYNDIFSNSYTDSSGITWYFKGYSKTSDCGGGYYGHYEGRTW